MNDQKPKQYIQGYTEFYKLKFKVTPDVLIPRPETELLVDIVLGFCETNPSCTILDLGTGSGNIAISIAKNTANTRNIIASDISQKALDVARHNAKLNKISDRTTFVISDLLENITQQPDVIVTNLPYIPSERIDYLDSSVKDFEPHVALDGGEDGFYLYKKLFEQTQKKQWQPKLIIGEIDYTHGELAVNVAQKFFPRAEIEVKKDLAHKQRILLIRKFL